MHDVGKAAVRNEQPTAVMVDSRILQSTPVRGERAEYDCGERRKVSNGT